MVVKIFATSIGVIATFIVGIALLVYIEELIESAINDHKYKKQLKRRFNGGPTAECFCKDCKFYNETSKPNKYNHGAGDCSVHQEWGVRDNCYCWAATPLDNDEAKRREEIEKGE